MNPLPKRVMRPPPSELVEMGRTDDTDAAHRDTVERQDRNDQRKVLLAVAVPLEKRLVANLSVRNQPVFSVNRGKGAASLGECVRDLITAEGVGVGGRG